MADDATGETGVKTARGMRVTIFLLGVLGVWVVNLWGRFTVLLIGGLVYVAGHYTPMRGQVIAAYAITWLLLLYG